AARLGRRFGLVNTMVFTHIPSSVCLILAAFSSSLTIVLALLLVRSALSQMDVPTRTSYVMAVVTPAERTAAASVTAVPRSLASSISPALAGLLLATSFSGLPLVVCGALEIVYDVSLMSCFRHLEQRHTNGTHAIDEAQIKAFAIQFDPQPFHLDDAAAKGTLFGGLAASGWHTAAVTMRLLVDGGAPIAGGIIGAGGEVAWPQ